MKCPHCLVAVHVTFTRNHLTNDNFRQWEAHHAECPNCGRAVIHLLGRDKNGSQHISLLAYPKGMARPPAPPEVPERFSETYAEANRVLEDSAKASAALGRRLLQDAIREKVGITRKTLDEEIQAVIDSGEVPSWLADNLDAVRVVGNFAAHPIKSTNTGEIVDVEPGEAEWLLEVLDGMFDFYFVQPEKAKKRQADLNAKLKEAGKPELKKVPAAANDGDPSTS
ncbi:MAG: DUF4145 domain-containing protein [Gaiellaceae bacterium]